MKPISWLQPIERGINKLTGSYSNGVQFILKRGARVGLLVLVGFAATGWLTSAVPTAFVPGEDQGYVFVDIQLPDAASANRTEAVIEKLRQYCKLTRR